MNNGEVRNMKKVAIWVVAHVVVYTIVTNILREQGMTEDEAKLGGHIAGGVTGLVLSNSI